GHGDGLPVAPDLEWRPGDHQERLAVRGGREPGRERLQRLDPPRRRGGAADREREDRRLAGLSGGGHPRKAEHDRGKDDAGKPPRAPLRPSLHPANLVQAPPDLTRSVGPPRHESGVSSETPSRPPSCLWGLSDPLSSTVTRK